MDLVFLTNVNGTQQIVDILSGAQRRSVLDGKKEDLGNPLKSALVLGRSGIRCDGGGVGGVKVQRHCHIILPPDILSRGSRPDHKQMIIGRKKRRMMEVGGPGYPQRPRMRAAW